MNNRLPEKLNTLRTHCSYAQADVASKVGVTVAEYMDWENGNKLCTINKLKELAKLYGIPVQQLIDNTVEVDLPRVDTAFDSVQIPFMQDVEPTAAPAAQPAPQQPAAAAPAAQNLGDTIQANVLSGTKGFDPTTVNRIVDDTDEFEDEDDEEEEKPRRAKSDSGMNKKLIIIIGGIAAALVVVFLVFKLLTGGSGGLSLSLGSDNRLALSDSFSLYLADDGSVKSYGSAPSVSQFTNVVQISAGSDFALGLKKTGKVICSGSSTACQVNDWKDITMIAAGDSHSVGLKSDGTVVCTGSSAACQVDQWKDVSKVYAGHEVTVGLKKDGTLLISGTVASGATLSSLTNVDSVAVGANEISVISNGAVTDYAIGTAATSNTDGWGNVRQVALGSDFAAALGTDGTVKVASSNDAYSSAVSGWTGIKYIAGRNNTLIAVGADNSIIGAGDNSKNLYGSSTAAATATATATPTASATPTPTAASTKLDKVTNFNYSFDTNNMNLSWNAVSGAQYYEVTVNTNPITTVKAANAGTAIPASKLTNGATYTISIVSVAKDTKNNSDPYTYNVVYKAAQVKLATPGNASAKPDGTKLTVNWSAVEHADYYIVTVNGTASGNVTGTSYDTDLSSYSTGSGYAVTIVAYSNSSDVYTQSDPATATFDYTAPVVQLKKPTILSATPTKGDNDTYTVVVTWDTPDPHASSYEVIFGNQPATASGTATSYTFEGVPKGNYTVLLKAISGDPSLYSDSEQTSFPANVN